jgi:hypothetical protein
LLPEDCPENGIFLLPSFSISFILFSITMALSTPMWTKFYSCKKWVLHARTPPPPASSGASLPSPPPSSQVAGARAAGVAAGPPCSTTTARVATELASPVSATPCHRAHASARAAMHAGLRAVVRWAVSLLRAWAVPGKTMGRVRCASRAVLTLCKHAVSALWPWAARYCATGRRRIQPIGH